MHPKSLAASLAALLLAACATAPTAPPPAAVGTPGASDAPMRTADVAPALPAPAIPRPVTENRVFDLPYVQRTLPNGLVAIAVKTPFEGIVSLQIPVRVGSRNEVEPGKTGFAHFFEHMMFRGTPNNPPAVYGAAMQRAGADQNAYTDDDFTNYYVNFASSDLDRVLALEADRFQNLAYSEEQFRTEALAVKGEYLKNYANPLLKGYEALQGLAFTTHTYRHTTIGFFEDIERMPEQLEYSKQFFARWYRPEHAAVIVVGDVEPEAALAAIERHFGGWQRGSHEGEVPVEPPQDAPRYAHVEWRGPTLPWLLHGWKAPAFATEAPDTAALAVLAEMYFGPSSPLYQDLVVTRRLVDQMTVSPPYNRDPWLFTLALRLTAPEHAGAVNAAIQDTILSMRSEPADPARLADTRSRLRYAFATGMNSAAAIGAILARFVHYERDVETVNRYYDALARVDAGALRDVANRVFADAVRSTVSIARSADLPGANDFRPLDAELAAARATIAARAPEPAPQPAAAPRKRVVLLDTEASQRRWAAQEAMFSVPLVAQPSNSPLVDVSLVLRAGAAWDPPGKRGLAALTAAMIVNGGSAEKSFEQITRELYPLAAGLNVQVDKDLVRVYGTVHRDNALAWWTVVKGQIFDPGFREQDFARVKQQQLNAIRVSLRSNNDEELAKEALYELAYGKDHPYGTLTLGAAKELESITLADVRRFYKSRWVRSRLTMGIAGGYDDVLRETVHGSSMRWPWVPDEEKLALPPAESRKVPQLAVPPAPVRGAREALIIDKNAPAVAVSFGFPIDVRRGHPDWLALWLVRSWLGEHRNANGRLYQRIREQRGMNYGSYAYLEYFPNGMFLMQPEPNYARQNDLFQIWLRPLRDNNDALFATRTALFELEGLIERGLAQQEFERTRDFLKKFVGSMTAVQARRLGYGIDSRYFGIPEFADYVKNGLDALTLAQVNAAIRRHFRTDAIRFVFVSGDAKGLAEALASGRPSPVSYNTDKPAELLAEDARIARWPLKIARRDIRIVPGDRVFE